MHTVHIHIDETLANAELQRIGQTLMHRPHVAHVLFNDKLPHDLLVEYDERHIHPMDILNNIAYTGLHTDVTYC
jgi:hypothetical protein